MRQHRDTFALVVFATMLGGALRAQEPVTPQASTPLQVQVIVSRYPGDKKVSSLP